MAIHDINIALEVCKTAQGQACSLPQYLLGDRQMDTTLIGIPGQASSLHVVCFVRSPVQSSPPCAGSGSVQDRLQS